MSKKTRTILIIIFTILCVAINFLIVYESCLSGPTSTIRSEGLTETLSNIINTFKEDTINETNFNNFQGFIRKFVGHFSLFLVDALITTTLFYLVIDKNFLLKIVLVFSIGLFFASLSEVIQKFVFSRYGAFSDVLIDMAGYIIGEGILVLIYQLVMKKKKTKD